MLDLINKHLKGAMVSKDKKRIMSLRNIISELKMNAIEKKDSLSDAESVKVIQSIADELNLDYIQLHGDESPEYCKDIVRPVIKVFRVDNHVDNSALEGYDVHAFLLDTYEKGNPGGTGECFNWDLVLSLKTKTPIILSGGLNSDNIIKGIQKIQPAAVDVNSGVESSPGEKDGNKMIQLFNRLNNTENHSNLFNDSILEENDEL